MAMLIQNQDGMYEYFSINGDNVYFSGNFSGGRQFNDVGVKGWSNPQEFMNSDYNERTENSQNDPDKNHFGFSEGYHIKTTPEQDETMRNSFAAYAESKYDIFYNNCATTVQRVMIDGGLKVSEKSIINIVTATLLDVLNLYKFQKVQSLPSIAFKMIQYYNPGGELIEKEDDEQRENDSK